MVSNTVTRRRPGSRAHAPRIRGAALGRALLASAALAAASCAAAGRAPPTATPVGARAAGPHAAAVPRGFEPQPGEIATARDLTHAGKPNVWRYAVRDADGKAVLVRQEKDLNGDGKVDVWERYAPDGTLLMVAYDLDFDGRPDETLTFSGEQLVKKEMAYAFDGIPRSWSIYEGGKLVRKERDTDGDGKVDTWEYWEDGVLDRIGVDVDRDGKVDRWDARRGAQASPGDAPQK